jgi:hypothetical protein
MQTKMVDGVLGFHPYLAFGTTRMAELSAVIQP